jgi:hypothetical protein
MFWLPDMPSATDVMNAIDVLNVLDVLNGLEVLNLTDVLNVIDMAVTFAIRNVQNPMKILLIFKCLYLGRFKSYSLLNRLKMIIETSQIMSEKIF